jgi:putative phosphoribosyl transferase
VARALDAPLEVLLVRKPGVPGHRGLATGAIASGGVRVLNEDVVTMYRLPGTVIDAVVREERAELERGERAYRSGRAAVELRRRVVLLVDDDLATGASMKGPVEAVRAHDPARLVLAVPAGSP